MVDTNFPCGNKGDGRNLFVMATATKETYVDYNGIEKPATPSHERTSDYIDVKAGESITVFYTGTTLFTVGFTYWAQLLWYDPKKSFLFNSALQENNETGALVHFSVTKTFTVPPNAVYLRISARFYDDGRIKAERGSIPTPWTPAPEDVVVKSELEALIKRVAALEKKAGITSADSSAELPSVDMMEPVDDMETSSIEMEDV